MSTILKRPILLFSSLLLLLAACQAPTPTAALAIFTPASTKPSTATPTRTVTPMPTALPTVAPTTTPLPSPSPTPTALPTQAATTSEVYVNSANSLNLRAEANVSATLIRTLSAGTHLTAIGPATAPDAAGIAWQNVRTDEGLSGWVAAQYLTISAATPSITSTPSAASNAQPGYVYVDSTAGLNLRADHRSSSDVLATLSNGQRLQTNGLNFGPDSEGIAWLNVKTDNGFEGWVAVEFVNTTVPSVAPAQPPTDVAGAVAELLRRTNDLRQQNGLPPFTLDAGLSVLALAHSQYMAQNGITHSDANGQSPSKRLKSEGYTGQPSENIFGGQASMDDAWDFWSTDPPHLTNLLSTANTIIGIGVYQSGAATYYTQDFARPPAQ